MEPAPNAPQTIHSISDLLNLWDSIASAPKSNQPQQNEELEQTKKQMLKFLYKQPRFDDADKQKLDDLKAKISTSGDADFLKKVERATKRQVFSNPTSRDNSSALENLPTDLLGKEILGKLDRSSQRSMERVSTRFRAFLDNPAYLADIVNHGDSSLNEDELMFLLERCGDKVQRLDLSKFCGVKVEYEDFHTLKGRMGINSNKSLLMRSVKLCPNLKGLSLMHCSPDDLNEIAKLSHLECLSLKRSFLDSTQLSVLIRLKELSLKDCALDQDGLQVIGSSLTHLETLDLSGTKKLPRDPALREEAINDQDMIIIATLHNLKELNLSDAFVGNDGLRMLVSNLRKLEKFTLQRSANNETVKELANISNLRELDLSGSFSINSKGMADLAKLVQLRKLNLAHTKVGSEGMTHLANLQHLKELDLTSIPASDGLKGVNDINWINEGTLPPNLVILNLNQTLVGDIWMSKVSKLRNLRELRIQDTLVSDKGMIDIAKLSHLKVLEISNHKSCGALITRAGIRLLTANLSELHMLFINRIPLYPEDIALLASITELRKLSITD